MTLPLSGKSVREVVRPSLELTHGSRVPSPSQREAIEAAPGPALVLAGPGAGKTFCLIERIRFLIERRGFDPARICVFTFTNKAADEIASRLSRQLGDRADGLKRRTIHAFCAELLRELGTHVGLRPGFGIADEADQLLVLRRLQGPRRRHRTALNRFSTYRFRGDRLPHRDTALFADYEQFLAKRGVLDFDSLVLKAAELLEGTDAAAAVRSRWDAVLVDEFQDLNPVQYRIVRELARAHGNIFAVGDDDQSIYSWAGADPGVFKTFVNDFGLTRRVHLEENRRCPRDAFALARRLVAINTPIFPDRAPPKADRASRFPVVALDFDSDRTEIAWIIDDIRHDRTANGHDWGDVALLYRTHEIGNALEAACVNAGISCRLAHGRALAEEPVVAYVLAALRVIANPNDDVSRERFFSVALPTSVFDNERARAQASRHDIVRQLRRTMDRLPKGDETRRRIRHALRRYANLAALGRGHTRLASLIQELLSQRVGRSRSLLDERHDELSDPLAHEEVAALAARLRAARERNREIAIPRLGGVEIALRGMLLALGFRRVRLGAVRAADAEDIGPADAPALGLPLALFKAAQLVEIGEVATAFRDFTAIDLETTDRDPAHAEIVEIAAVRVRDGRPTDKFNTLVRPRVPVSATATDTHSLRDADLAAAPPFEDIWPKFQAFCGGDIVVAHNGYAFDFPILKRMVRALGKRFELCTYDTLPLARELCPTSRKLVDLARTFQIDPGQAHRALSDARALAQILLALDEAKLTRARKTALSNLLDHLGVALALSDASSLCDEAKLLRDLCRPFALARYSCCLEFYERERSSDESLPGVDEVIDALGGAKLMLKIRSEKSAEQRYPAVMARLRRLLERETAGPLEAQIVEFIERAVLSSKSEGVDVERDCVNLLTLHSTKGLEFSRVYVVGVEDVQLPGIPPDGEPTRLEIEEARRLLYVGMTRAKDRLVLTRVAKRGGKSTGGHRFLDEMGLVPHAP